MPGARRRLGRGLDSLLPDLEPHEGDLVRAVACDAVGPNPEQPRRSFDPEALEELAASIRVHGVLQPVIVRQAGGAVPGLPEARQRFQAGGRATAA